MLVDLDVNYLLLMFICGVTSLQQFQTIKRKLNEAQDSVSDWNIGLRIPEKHLPWQKGGQY